MRASYEERKSFGETKRGPIEEGVHLQDLSPAVCYGKYDISLLTCAYVSVLGASKTYVSV